jgi:uncharacterized protein (DUF1697 family)
MSRKYREQSRPILNGNKPNATVFARVFAQTLDTKCHPSYSPTTRTAGQPGTASMKTFIGLLRGINVGGHNKIPMSELRKLCGELGWDNVQTYIQSGNLVFSAAGKPASLEAELQRSIEKHFGFSIPIIIRAGVDWPGYVKANPFLKACKKESHLVMLYLSKLPPGADAIKRLRERAADGERIAHVGDALWIHFAGKVVARSKLSPSFLDRMVGSSVTARNWLTVLKLNEMANAPVEKMVK